VSRILVRGDGKILEKGGDCLNLKEMKHQRFTQKSDEVWGEDNRGRVLPRGGLGHFTSDGRLRPRWGLGGEASLKKQKNDDEGEKVSPGQRNRLKQMSVGR